jgi:hypothetical protein
VDKVILLLSEQVASGGKKEGTAFLYGFMTGLQVRPESASRLY